MNGADKKHMRAALELARKGYGRTSPNPMVGALLVKGRAVIGTGWHRKAGSAHAEIEALNDARRNDYNIKNATLYVTLEPCVMCAGASFWTQIKKIVFGATDEKKGFSKLTEQITHPKTEIESGVLQEECAKLLSDFFKSKR